MVKFCPACGKPIAADTSKFCDDCGAKLIINGPNEKKESVQLIQEEKNRFLAGLCSFCIPGLGQVYNGETAKGVRVFFGTLIGLFLFIIPGLIVWFLGIYDAYSIAAEMNKKEIPFKPTKTTHMIIFFILAFFIIVIACFFVFALFLSAIFGPFLSHPPNIK